MRSSSVAQAILSLVTTPDRAESVAGDLTEDRARHGASWFWFHLLGCAWALSLRELLRDLSGVLALAFWALSLLTSLGFAGTAAVFLFPGFGASLSMWLGVSFIWWIGAWWTGSSVVSLAPRIGMSLCLLLAVTGESLLVAAAGSVWPPSIHASACFALVLFLIGAAVARRHVLSRTMNLEGRDA
jgi:hypothetical protein